MTNPDQYVHDVLVDWMEKNEPETLAVIRSNDMQATSAAVLGWMAKNKADDLWQIQSIWEESVDDDTDQNYLECVGALKVTDWKAMCTNARLETVDTTAAYRDAYKRRRALIPITSFIEYDKPPGWAKGRRAMALAVNNERRNAPPEPKCVGASRASDRA
jgi:putative SOS response-associated peptidase YedK